MMVHKILNEQCPEILKQKFTKRSQVSKYETRRVNYQQIPRPRLEIAKRAFRTKVPRCGMISQTILEMWNLLHFSKNRLETIFWANKTSKTHRRPQLTLCVQRMTVLRTRSTFCCFALHLTFNDDILLEFRYYYGNLLK